MFGTIKNDLYYEIKRDIVTITNVMIKLKTFFFPIGIFCLLFLLLAGCKLQGQPSEIVILSTETPTSLPITISLTASPQATIEPSQTTSPTEMPSLQGNFLFDDFSYTDQQALIANGWIIREKVGWPGIPEASWLKENVSFVDDPDQPGGRLLQMTSSSDGTVSGTYQTQICQQRKFLEGTYATRVRFSDEPISGPDGDQLVETFYMISPYEKALDPDYSEMDNEYLPNGGWGHGEHTFFVTTWETVQIEPWIAENTYDTLEGSLAGWHTLVVQVVDGDITYLLDGKMIAQHWGKYFPEVPMSINYNLWFVDVGLIESNEVRQYIEQIDWVYFEANESLTPPQVEARVAAMREAALPFEDTVPAWDPPMPSLCDL